ncbi:uracil-DNA glycosylase family protein [Maribacter confluentis]|uniref:Uracil-DNA glycosylase family protein n=1 Tax=Maribacter confluentis TaxID=1656093 RepID=A0ABT8RLU7_9FLAO|nr:uracil-DNA glycosylase family protein [Maribacter confluentis]MDO1511879.1 uracil-DNA glycosylase family protein [Maribacter confluentis]
MFLHTHPYKPFIQKDTVKLIVGTLPPPRFTTGELKEGDVDFCYGSRDGQLWPILDRIYNLNLRFETTQEAVDQRKRFLKQHKIGICDIVAAAKRNKIDASDIGMQQIVLRNVLSYLEEYPKVEILLFTGGNSKNGPEYFFRKHLRDYGISLKKISDEVPRIHRFIHPKTGVEIKTVSLTAPSGAANRAVGSLESYKKLKLNNPEFTTLDFRVMQYKDYF